MALPLLILADGAQAGEATFPDLSPAQITSKYGKAVVLIATVRNSTEVGLGSGFLVRSDGVIVTNYHVIEGAYPALVKLTNKDIFDDIEVIDYNERQDVAVIKIKGFDLPAVVLGNSNAVTVGESVVVIGNPHGYETTVSNGLLSQIRDTDKGITLHQISAPISAGSSGSPVFNSKGEVIGIATLSDILGQNLNFSVPINYVRGMVEGKPRWSLKEFAGLPKDPSVVGLVKAGAPSDERKVLEELNKGLSH